MNKSTLRSVTLMLLLGGLGSAPSAFAVTFLEDLAAGNARTDVYRLICPMGTVQARGSVRDINPANAPLIRMAIAKFPGAGVVEAPQEGVSAAIAVVDGPGTYHIMVYKNDLAMVETYYGQVDCLDAMGASLAPINWALTQDE